MHEHITQWIRCSIVAGIMMFLIGSVFFFLVPVMFPEIEQLYQNIALFRPWRESTSTYMMLHPFLYGPIFAAVFLALRKGTTFPAGIRGGFLYGAGVFSVGSLPIFVLEFAAFQVTADLIGLWIFQNLCQYLAAGIAVGCVADGVTVRVSTELEASADHVWERLLQKKTYLYLVQGWLAIEKTQAWPDAFFVQGASIVMQIRLFGKGPLSSHEAQVVLVDESAREIATDESSRLVRIWKHCMRVEALPGNRSRYTDRVLISAGLLTPAVWLFASLFYRARQQRWKRLLAEFERENPDG